MADPDPEVEQLRSQLAAANVVIDDLRAQLAAAHRQLAAQHEQLSSKVAAGDGGEDAKPTKRTSIAIEDCVRWLDVSVKHANCVHGTEREGELGSDPAYLREPET